MAGVMDIIKMAVSTATNNAAKTAAGAVKNKVVSSGASAGGSSNRDINAANGTYNKSGAWTDNEMLTAPDLQKIAEYRAGIGTKYTGDEANALANQIRSGYGYSIDKQGNVTNLLSKSLREDSGYGKQSDGYMSFEDFMDSNGYDQYAEQTRAAIQAAVDKAVNGYRDQIDVTNRDSDELARQAYIAKMQGQKNLDQQMAANGYAGGMADSQRIATETDYQNRLSEIEKQRLATVKELESAITNAQLTGDMQTAQELSDYLQNIENQWNAYVQNQKSMDNQNYWNQQNLDMQTTENNRNWVLQQLAKGIMPDDDTLAAAGITKQAAQQQVALALAGGTGTVSKSMQGTPGRTQGGGYNNGSLTSAQVQELQKALGVTEDGLWGSKSKAAAGGMTADEAWDAYQNQTNASNAGMNASYFNAFMQSMVAQMSAGKMQAAQANIQANWDKLSDSQKEQLIALTQKYS